LCLENECKMENNLSISVKNADIFQREQLVLSDVNFDIKNGEFVYLIGRVGSGKSSLIKTMHAELPLYNGQISIAGFDIQSIKQRQVPYLRRKVGVVFQDFKLLTDRNIYKNLFFVLKATGWKDKKTMDERIDQILSEICMTDHKMKMPHQLSGGEQQRIVIARALLNNPEILLADEPTGNLDHYTSMEILELFKKINSTGITIIMATHDKLLFDQYPARTLICSNGKVLESSPQSELLDFKSFVD
jgi:cell division transport system ATP-binding protein